MLDTHTRLKKALCGLCMTSIRKFFHNGAYIRSINIAYHYNAVTAYVTAHNYTVRNSRDRVIELPNTGLTFIGPKQKSL